MQVEQLDDHNNATEPPGLPKVLNTTTFQGKSEWRIEVSDMAKRTMNPIRRAMSGMKMVPNEKYSVISLSIGKKIRMGFLDITVGSKCFFIDKCQSSQKIFLRNRFTLGISDFITII